MALGEKELQQAPNKNVLSPHLMLMSGLTIFFLFWILIIFSFAHKLSHYKHCCITLFQIHIFHIITKCDHTVPIMMKCAFREETMCCGKLGKGVE